MVDAITTRATRAMSVDGVRREALVVVAGIGLCLVGLVVPHPLAKVALLIAGCGLFFALVAKSAADLLVARRQRSVRVALAGLIDSDAAPGFLTDMAGAVLHVNPAADPARKQPGTPFHEWLDDVFAAPAASVADLIRQASDAGSARVDRLSRDGQLRVTVTSAPAACLLWRVENLTVSRVAAGVSDIALPALVVGRDGLISGGNSAMTALLGAPVAGRCLRDILPNASLASGTVCALAGRGGPTQVRLLVIENAVGDASEVYFLPVDIAGYSSAAHLFDTLPVPMLKVRVDGQVLAANQGAGDLLGRPVAQGTSLTEVLSGLGRSLTDWLQDAVAGRGLSRSEFLEVRGRKGERFVQVFLKPIEEAGELAVVAVLTDATELKTLEAQFVQSQKMQAIGQLAGGVAHDFNNLLTAISGHCDLLLLRHDEGHPAYGDLVQINQNANRAAALVEQLLAFSRKQTLRPEVVDLSDVLSDLTHLLSRLVGETIRLSLRNEETAPTARVDKRQLEQVIMNLVVNARDAMPDGGVISVDVCKTTLATELRRNRAIIPPGDYATIRISDEGVGISPENLQKIFEPFYTTKKTGDGTGLGLSTAYGIVKQTGGFIFADSTPGAGSVFTLYFPVHTEEAAAEIVEKPAEPAREPVHQHGVVLLVEDEAPVRAFASRALRMQGLTVIEAENAEQALEQLEDSTLEVDVFVTDVVMPGMDGPSWVRQALEDRPDTRVIFVSGYAEDALSDQRERIPNSVFLPKPFSLRDLTTTVQQQMA